MVVPKKRKSNSKSRSRRNFYRIKAVQIGTCKKCGVNKIAHNICKTCGFYKEIKIVKLQKELLK